MVTSLYMELSDYCMHINLNIHVHTCRTLRDYTKWRFVQSYLPHLSEDFRDALQVFVATVQGIILSKHSETSMHIYTKNIIWLKMYASIILRDGNSKSSFK